MLLASCWHSVLTVTAFDDSMHRETAHVATLGRHDVDPAGLSGPQEKRSHWIPVWVVHSGSQDLSGGRKGVTEDCAGWAAIYAAPANLSLEIPEP